MSLVAIDQDAFERSMRELRDELARVNRRLDAVQMTPRPEWITVDQFAQTVGKHKKTVLRWIKEGKVTTSEVAGVRMCRLNLDA